MTTKLLLIPFSLWLLSGLAVANGPERAAAFNSQDGKGEAQTRRGPAGEPLVRVNYPGQGRWHLSLSPSLAVRPQQTFRFRARVKINQSAPMGECYLAVMLRDEKGEVINEWFAPLMPDFQRRDWQQLENPFAIPRRGRRVELRLWGEKAFDIEVSGASLVPTGSLAGQIAPSARRPWKLGNGLIQAEVDPRQWGLSVTDRRCGQRWNFFPADDYLTITGVTETSRTSECALTLKAVYLPALAPMQLKLELPANAPEFTIRTSLPPKTPMPHWAAIFETVPAFCMPSAAKELVVPLGEGFLYPTMDPKLPTQLMQFGQGYGMTMDWFGMTDQASGAAAMCLVRDADDAMARLLYQSKDGQAAGTVLMQWLPQKNQWGAADRRVTFWFADKGGYVGLCKRYRREAMALGRVVTLAEKERHLPQVKNLLGAPDCWFFFLRKEPSEARRMEMLRWLHERGMNRLLLSTAPNLRSADEILSWGWLTSAYDLYSDVWPPDQAAKAGEAQRTFGWPDDIQVTRHGEKKRGWVVKKPDGEYPSYVLCMQRQLDWARRRIPPALQPAKMTARLLDTTTGLEPDECYSPAHPMTRAEDKAARKRLLGYVGKLGLICGSEGGADWAVPEICYSEGMLSPPAYQNPNAGYLLGNMKPVENTYKFMLNPAVRVPLWELVYHDCTVSYWYWGDANNTFPELWPRRNAFNALYALPPLYFLPGEEKKFLDQRERIVGTDRYLKPVFEAVGFEEMVEHQFLSPDRLLQMTRYAGGARVIVNFAGMPRDYQGQAIPPLGYIIQHQGKIIVPKPNIASQP